VVLVALAVRQMISLGTYLASYELGGTLHPAALSSPIAFSSVHDEPVSVVDYHRLQYDSYRLARHRTGWKRRSARVTPTSRSHGGGAILPPHDIWDHGQLTQNDSGSSDASRID
jgi:hypothetical protein